MKILDKIKMSKLAVLSPKLMMKSINIVKSAFANCNY
jgi:hypothetical protein